MNCLVLNEYFQISVQLKNTLLEKPTKSSYPVKNKYPIDIRIGLKIIYIDETILYEVDQKSYQGSSGNTIKITSILQVGV